ncbi:hypothetical protein GY45DRAFT_1330749 [Cubamyces sp. BRFM 1775]|nr:hypothetical protein GY45DRAFT_1330749 [Cubamyces sp. BRFM 1775]
MPPPSGSVPVRDGDDWTQDTDRLLKNTSLSTEKNPTRKHPYGETATRGAVGQAGVLLEG